MIVDLRTLEEGALVEADLCIIGAGAAGITLARELVGSSAQVCLVEAGGLEFESEVQDFYVGENVGQPYAMEVQRLRYFGGSTNHWVGYCAPLTPLDFEVRSWVPHSGWPITRTDLDPYYRRAQSVCQLSDYDYGSPELWRRLSLEAESFDPNEIEYCFWQFSPPTRFGEVYRAELEQAANIRILLNANVTAIQTDGQAATVRHVDLRTLQGKAARVRARTYVLACGAIENARLLLLSNAVEPAGLGNRNDLVGRFFMEHPHVTVASIVTTDKPQRVAKIHRRHELGGVPYEPHLCAGSAMQAREQVLTSHAMLRHYVTTLGPGMNAMRQMWKAVRQGRVPDSLTEKVWTVVNDLDGIADFALRRFGPDQWPLYVIAEQAPDPESRVSLAEAQDALGQRRVRLDWRLGELDKRTVMALTQAIAAEVTRLGIGRVRLEDWLQDKGPSWPSDLEGGGHHIGTTRMATDAKQGVVDPDCRMHHIDNLYIAGSSVFPTGGSANPTLTIVAMTLRLADHLKQRLAQG